MLPSSHGHRGSSSAMPGFVVRVIIELGILAFIVVSYEAHRNQHGVNPLAGAADVHALAERLETWKGHAGPADAPALQRLIQELKDLQGAKQTVAALRGEAKKPCKQEAKKTEAAVATAAAVEASSQAWEEKTFYALSIAGTQCHQAHHADLWGDPVIWGGEHHTATASECCAACQAHRQAAMRGGLNKGPNSTFCNVWVHCGCVLLTAAR